MQRWFTDLFSGQSLVFKLGLRLLIRKAIPSLVILIFDGAKPTCPGVPWRDLQFSFRLALTSICAVD
jgi:hypothetical protein